MNRPIEVFVIRTKKVGKWPREVRCPFQVGCLMAVEDGVYSRFTMTTVHNDTQATLFASREDAQRLIDEYKHAAVIFEVVKLTETRDTEKEIEK